MRIWDNLRFVVAQTGRSASGFTAKKLTSFGIPTGHEAVFNPYMTQRTDLLGDSSWLAAPHLGEFSGKVIHQVRHPAKVIRSWLLASPPFFLSPFHPYGGYRAKYSPWAAEAIGAGYHVNLEWAARHYIEWNRMIEPHARYRFQIENPDWLEITEAIGYPISTNQAPPVNKEYNKHVAPGGQINREDLVKLSCFDQLNEMATEYGYDLMEASAYEAAG